MDYKNLFEKFNEGGKLLLKDATVTFDAIPWSKHPTFEGVELPYETGVISIYGHYYYNIPQPTAAIKPKSKKAKRIILFVDARAIMHIYGILYQINRELNSPASIHTKG